MLQHRQGSADISALKCARMTCIPPNKYGESVTKVIHVIVTSCRPPDYVNIMRIDAKL